MKKQKKSVPSNTKIAVVFFVFLALFVGISLTIKVIILIRNSQFDNSKRFTLSIANGRNLEIMSFSPDSKEVSVFKFSNNLKPEEAGRLLEIPIDGHVASDSLDLSQNFSSIFMTAILKSNSLKTNLTIIDLIRLEMLARAIPEKDINAKTVDVSPTGVDNNTVGRLVIDSLVEKDHQTIKIINATGVGGLGGRLARLVTNIGGNVIIVSTENGLGKRSSISYIDDKTYTVNRLQKVLGYEVVKESNNAISDITITIGEDKLNSIPF